MADINKDSVSNGASSAVGGAGSRARRVKTLALPGKIVGVVLALALLSVLALRLYKNNVAAGEPRAAGPRAGYEGVMGIFTRPEFEKILFIVQGAGVEEEDLIKRRSDQMRPAAALSEISRQEWERIDAENKELTATVREALLALSSEKPSPQFYGHIAQVLECANKLRDNGRILTENDSAPSWLGMVYINAADELSRALAEFLKSQEQHGSGEAVAKAKAKASADLRKVAEGIESSISASASGGTGE
ncbi:MAG: hypothetical protein GX410_09395 [Elusimicrobia bacterium]|nr:hypothetical protein [Elusimicrobiota bacterium]